jgi:hypothetical protein
LHRRRFANDQKLNGGSRRGKNSRISCGGKTGNKFSADKTCRYVCRDVCALSHLSVEFYEISSKKKENPLEVQ